MDQEGGWNGLLLVILAMPHCLLRVSAALFTFRSPCSNRAILTVCFVYTERLAILASGHTFKDSMPAAPLDFLGSLKRNSGGFFCACLQRFILLDRRVV